jgi:hypothetical protein
MRQKHTKIGSWLTLVVIAFLTLLPLLFAPFSPVAEAGGVKEQSARAGWTKCTGTTCIETVIIGTMRGSSKTLSFAETTYKKATGKVVSRREAFARIGNFTQDRLQSASVNARIAVKRCDAQDVCKNAGKVHIKAKWTGKGKVRTDPEDKSRVRDATVSGTVAGNGLGSLNFANLSVLPK